MRIGQYVFRYCAAGWFVGFEFFFWLYWKEVEHDDENQIASEIKIHVDYITYLQSSLNCPAFLFLIRFSQDYTLV